MPSLFRWIVPTPIVPTASVTAPTIWWSDTGTNAATSAYWPWTTQATTGSQSGPMGTYYTAVDQHDYQRIEQLPNLQMAQQLYRRQAAHERYTFQMRPAGGLGSLFTPAAPAIITQREQERLDREGLARAIAEHDEQEAARIMRQIEAREQGEAARRRAIEEHQEAERERRRAGDAAKAMARELLLTHLTPEQRETFERGGWFIVEGGRSKTKYRINAKENMVANVDVLNSNKTGPERLHRLCAHARLGEVPLGDQLLSQKIMIELAEDDFLRIANRHAA